MADARTVERLRHYLRELSPQARSLLIDEFERSLLRGDDITGADLVLRQLRRIAREGRDGTPRVAHAARLFFRAFEPFLVDDTGDHRHPGRIARASLEPLWTWARRDLLPEEGALLAAEVDATLAAGDESKAEQLVAAFQDRVAVAMDTRFAAAAKDERMERRLLAQIGTARPHADAQTLLRVLKGRKALAQVSARLPLQITNLGANEIDACISLIEDAAAHDGELRLYLLLTVMDRLTGFWQLIRFGTKAANSVVAARVAETPYGIAVPIVLAELERLVRELRGDLRDGGVAVGALLKAIHDCVRGLRTEIALPVDSTWGRALSTQRAQVADILRSEIENTPGRVRRLLRARSDGDGEAAAALSDDEVAETAARVAFTCTCRHFAGELAINEITRRAVSELEQYLDSATRGLLERVRNAGPGERRFRQSQFEAARRFCGIMFGPGYAAALSKAAELANTEPNTARA